MKVEQFIQTIANNPALPVRFQYGDGKVVQGGYHVTEIKNANYETIDCGNSLHTWQEVIVQVWVPEEAEADAPHMTADKFAKIWNVVDSRLALRSAADIRIEYGDGQVLTANYAVSDIEVDGDAVTIKMTPPITQCKPRAILAELNGVVAGCCTPAAQPVREETVLPLSMVNACC